MDADFWLGKWSLGEIGFHQTETNPHLMAYWDQMSVKVGERVFVPLCGKSLDMCWLRAQGHSVVGVELSQSAVSAFFDALGLQPTIREEGPLIHYVAEGLEIFQGDFFELTSACVGPVHAVYDRAALVALPGEMRKAYAQHLMAITQCAPQLLITLSYDQAQLQGPPFSVTPEEVKQHYAQYYDVASLHSERLPDGFKTIDDVTQYVLKMNKR